MVPGPSTCDPELIRGPLPSTRFGCPSQGIAINCLSRVGVTTVGSVVGSARWHGPRGAFEERPKYGGESQVNAELTESTMTLADRAASPGTPMLAVEGLCAGHR